MALSAPVRDVLDPVTRHARFLFRDRSALSSNRRTICDEQGHEILFAEYEKKFPLAIALVLLVAAYVPIEFAMIGRDGTLVRVMFGVVALGVLLAPRLWGERTLRICRDADMRETFLEIQQQRPLAFAVARYTVKDDAGRIVAFFRWNPLKAMLRDEWRCHDANHELICVVKDDTRGGFVTRLRDHLIERPRARMNFLFFEGDTDIVIGSFDRSVLAGGRFVLDMSPDIGDHVERRVALAVALLIDCES